MPATRPTPSALPPSRARKMENPTGGVPCPNCKCGTQVVDSRESRNSIRRRRFCLGCGNRFTTWEVIGDLPPGQDALIAIKELRAMADRMERRLGETVASKEDAA